MQHASRPPGARRQLDPPHSPQLSGQHTEPLSFVPSMPSTPLLHCSVVAGAVVAGAAVVGTGGVGAGAVGVGSTGAGLETGLGADTGVDAGA